MNQRNIRRRWFDWKVYLKSNQRNLVLSEAPEEPILYPEAMGVSVRADDWSRKDKKYKAKHHTFYLTIAPVTKVDIYEINPDYLKFTKNLPETVNELVNAPELLSMLVIMARGHSYKATSKSLDRYYDWDSEKGEWKHPERHKAHKTPQVILQEGLKNLYTVMALSFEELLGPDFLNWDQEVIDYMNGPGVQPANKRSWSVEELKLIKERIMDKDQNGSFLFPVKLINEVLGFMDLIHRLQEAKII